jgi:ubiquinone/menaquinone biosynthesis C-methylase UbiE
MSNLEYHLHELEIQERPDDVRHVRPVVAPGVRRILDIGCGIGQTLMTTPRPEDSVAFGIDIDEEVLAYGAKRNSSIHFVRSSGERLPFADASFDMVIARVSLPWMHMPSALREMFRVLDRGGTMWVSLVEMSNALARLAGAVRTLNPKGIAYRTYVLANGILFHVAGRQFHFPTRKRPCESFQTTGGMIRALRAIGFDDVRVDRGKLFVVTAKKP